MEKQETKAVSVYVGVWGIKKRCRKTDFHLFEVAELEGVETVEAVDLSEMKEKAQRIIAEKIRVVDSRRSPYVKLQPITIEDRGNGFISKSYMMFSDTKYQLDSLPDKASA